MQKTILIATAARPHDEAGFRDICQGLRDLATENSLIVNEGILWTSGPGCSNLAIPINGDAEGIEEYGRQICMALMPAKWSFTNDETPEHDTFNL